MFGTRKLWIPVLAVLAAVSLMSMTCYIGGSPGGGSVSATVPFVQQQTSDYCAAACVLAWRLHDNLGTAPQADIFAAMGGIPGSGVSLWNIPNGVNSYTVIHDATVEYGPGGEYSTEQGQFFSRQITSVNSGVPVIAIQNQLHAVVIDGGSWHTDSTYGFHVWDSMEYMDPQIGFRGTSPGAYVSGFCPYDYTSCFETISSGAAAYGIANYSAYGDDTVGRGINREDICGRDCRIY